MERYSHSGQKDRSIWSASVWEIRRTVTLGGGACHAEKADVLIGAGAYASGSGTAYGKPTFAAYRPEEIRDYVYAHPEYERVVILLSGDVGFYSGAKKLLRSLCR